ncbi:MAG: DMT family transporter [Shimia sp.]
MLSLIWGCTFLAVKIALGELGPFTIVAHRVGWAALALSAVVYATGRRLPFSPSILIGFLGMGILNNVIPFTLQAWAQQSIESGLAAILNAGTAIWGVLIAALFLADERLTTRKIIGVSIGFTGVATAIGLGELLAFDPRSLAQWAMILSTISYAFAGVWARKRLGGLDPLVQAAGMLIASTLVMVPVAIAMEGRTSLNLAPQTIGALAFLSLACTAGAYLLYYRVLAMAGSANLMLCTLLIAPIAIVLGAVVLGEDLPFRAFAGFALLGAGLLILNGTLPLPRGRSTSRG